MALVPRLRLPCSILIGILCFVQQVELENVLIRNWRTGLELGTVRGNLMTTRLGQSFYAFRGIPYTKPPIGALRFKDPIPADPWQDVFDATKDGAMCPQRFHDASENISEDCLVLNVYTRWLPKTKSERRRLLPVMVYIYPSAFISWSGQSKNYAGPQYLLDREIVLVTFNYRLGAFGFLATGSKHSPGNYGLKDQIVVLKWVRDYIANFGGDPNLVTIIGQSAGAISATLHMVSPMAKGLFHRVIAMSGAATSPLTVPYDQLDLAKRQARLFNCTEDDIGHMVECLRKVDAVELAISWQRIYDFAESSPIIPFTPVIERDFGQDQFLVEDPTVLFQMGLFEQVPVMTGATKNELVFPGLRIIQTPDYAQQLDDSFIELSPICFGYDARTEQSRIASEVFRKMFLPGPIRNDTATVHGLNKLFSNGLVIYPVHRLVQLISKYVPVYYYQFAYVGRYTVTRYPDGDLRPVHVDDMLYLFVMNIFAPAYGPNDPESVTIERMTRLWTQFALTGNPNGGNDTYSRDVNWHQTSSDRNEYLEIGEELRMKEFLNWERIALWEKLFPLKPLPSDC